MVIVNTHKKANIQFKYFLEVPRSNCTFCSGRDKVTGRTRLYLVFNGQDRIYKRNGLKGTWDEICSKDEQKRIYAQLAEAVNNNVPSFKNNRFQSLLN